MKKVTIVRPNKRLISIINNKYSYTEKRYYAFYLLLNQHSNSGLIHNFSEFKKSFIEVYELDRKTFSSRVELLVKRGWISLNEKKDVLHVKSHNIISQQYYHNKNLKKIDLQCRCKYSTLYYKTEALANELYKQYKRKKYLEGNHHEGLAIDASYFPNWIAEVSRVEMASKVLGCYKHPSTGSRMIKRLKKHKLIRMDESTHVAIDGTYNQEAFENKWWIPDNKKGFHFYVDGKIYNKRINKVRTQYLIPTHNDKVFA